MSSESGTVATPAAGKLLRGRDQGDGTFASDQALILGLFTRVAALGLAVNMIGYASLSAVRKNRLSEPIFAKIMKLWEAYSGSTGLKISITKQKRKPIK